MNQNFSDPQREDSIIASLMAGGRELLECYEEFIDRHHFLDGDCSRAFGRMKELRDQNQEWGDDRLVYDRPSDKPQLRLFEIQ